MNYISRFGLVLAMLLVITLIPNAVKAIAIGENVFYLFEDEIRINDSSVVHDNSFQSPVCKNGVCQVGQQYERVTLYKTKESNVLTYEEWIDDWYLKQNGCEDMVNKKQQIADALEEWRQGDTYKQAAARTGSDKELNDAIWESIEAQYVKFMTETKGLAVIGNQLCKTINFSDYYDVYINNLKETALYSVTFANPEDKTQIYCDLGCSAEQLAKNFMMRLSGSPGYNIDLKTGTITTIGPSWILPVVVITGIASLAIFMLLVGLIRKQLKQA